MPRGTKVVVIGSYADQYICGECGYATSNKTGSRLHEKVTHGRDTKDPVFNNMFQCKMCKEKFDNMFQLKTHIKHEDHAATY
jgi:hypothetical protein